MYESLLEGYDFNLPKEVYDFYLLNHKNKFLKYFQTSDRFKKDFFDEFLERYDFDLQNLPEQLTDIQIYQAIHYILEHQCNLYVSNIELIQLPLDLALDANIICGIKKINPT